MKRTLNLIMTLALTLTTWSLRAAINPRIVEVNLDIEGVADAAEFTPGSGGFVAKGGWKMITLGVDGAGSARLNWNSTNVVVYTATNGTALANPTYWPDTATMPSNLWVYGVDASASGPSATNCGPEHICLEALNNGTSYATPYFDRVGFTVYHVAAITVRPKNAPEGWTPPDPVTIGAGAIHSPAHQADVTIQVLPAVAGIPIDVSLIGGLSHEPGKAAELVMGTLAATGGCAVVTVLTGTNGTISGELTSSDVNNMDCAIRAGTTETHVRFTWDEYFEQDAWTFEPDHMPVPGVLTNHFVLRHYRDLTKADLTHGTPWEPLKGHEIRFFVEKVEYWDADGNLCETNNTADAPADLSAWATFPTNSVTTDADGRATELLTIVTNANLHSVTVVAYDWGVFHEASHMEPVTPSEQRIARVSSPEITMASVTDEGVRSYIAFASPQVPVCMNTADTEKVFGHFTRICGCTRAA
ncbi:MAG: hypothetical protein FJ222_12385 [Lentisphaerae bacterium]|nr:hypothetical protein [Lentisphaerota bacterium]